MRGGNRTFPRCCLTATAGPSCWKVGRSGRTTTGRVMKNLHRKQDGGQSTPGIQGMLTRRLGLQHHNAAFSPISGSGALRSFGGVALFAGSGKSRAPRAIQRSARGCRSWVGATLIFGKQPIAVFRTFVNHRCFSQEHLQTYPVVSCRLNTLLSGSLASPEAKCWPVAWVTAGDNCPTSLPLLRPYYASLSKPESSSPARRRGRPAAAAGIVA